MDYNTRGFDKYHHVIQYVVPGEDKTVKICRCWQSKRFPYCDDTHKVLIEAGDNIGPYVAKIKGAQATRNVSANALRLKSQIPQNAFFFALGFGTVGLACVTAARILKDKRLSLGVSSPVEPPEGCTV